MSDFAPLDAAIDDLTARMSPASRKALSTRIATDLRNVNAKRERANIEPDGKEMEPRKAKRRGRAARKLRDQVKPLKGKVKDKMFLRASTARYLRKEASPGEAQVGFVGAMARIMRVHQLGLRDTVTRDPSSPQVTYPARVVLGIAGEDQAHILEQVADHLQ